ncbi:MAG TPA: hypothetical protein VF163_17570 [Micromonosporaceae bacterium]
MGMLRYSVGNEHNPGDPFGRSELVIQPDGAARLDHYFSRVASAGAWTGQVDLSALDALCRALDSAGFPAAPSTAPVAGATLRRLCIEVDGAAEHVAIDWHQASKLPGYAEVCDILDGVIRQLSAGAVSYPTSQPVIVSGVASAV